MTDRLPQYNMVPQGLNMLQQQQSMQQQFRPRSSAGMGPSQAQMTDSARTQHMARAPSGQQMPFGMGAGGMPNMGRQQPFHDPSSNQPANSNMPGGGFPNLGGTINQGMTPAQAQQRALNGFPQQRQLEMMMSNNPSMNFAKFPPQSSLPQRTDQLQQQQQQPFLNAGGMNQSSPADMFSPGMSNDLRRGSP
ncbi:hypothetical protein NMY22_g17356 [Coprinellus aureogranulatus]|nr:hypothetical protein NMY22_g17356 [Coprinellus aureogranulatus]